MAYIRAHETAAKRKGKAVKRYEVCWREPHPTQPGKTRARQESYPTRVAAEARRDELNAAKHTLGGTTALADAKKAGELTFRQYAAAWLARQATKVAEGHLKAQTADDYAALLRRYVPPHLVGKAVGAITPLDCEAFRAGLVARGLRPRTVRNAWNVFAAVLDYAARHGGLAANPAATLERATHAVGDRPAFEHRPLTGAQVAAVAAKVAERQAGPSGPVYGLVVLFLAYTGLRAGEAAGLEVRDVTLTTGPGPNGSTITKGAVRVQRTKIRRNGEWVTGTPKSARSKRTVPLPPWLAAKLADYLRTTHLAASDPSAPLWPRRLPGGARTKGARAVAVLDWGAPCDFGTLHERVLRPALDDVGLASVRMHDLRHTFAAMMLSAGENYMKVSRLLGHANYVVTMTTYAEWLPGEDTGNTLPEPIALTAPATNVVPLRPAQGE